MISISSGSTMEGYGLSLATYILYFLIYCDGQYHVPNVRFEAFSPAGLRISIPADEGVVLFAFHGNVNKKIQQTEPGEINQDLRRATKGRFSYIDTTLKLRLNDVVHYWMFIQYEQLGFKADDLNWTVSELLPLEYLRYEVTESCNVTTKTAHEHSFCFGDSVIEYRFETMPIDTDVWLIEQYISSSPDWLFNIYQNTSDVINIENNTLTIRPKLVEENARKDLDLYPGCTRSSGECVRKYISILNPPIISGKLRSKTTFCFGNITVEAKLPIGDYVFPELYLEDTENPERRLLIAYARGNKNYLQRNGLDEGGSLLFGGPCTSVREPTRSKYLSTYRSIHHIGQEWHVFNVIWTPTKIDLFMDGIHFGHHSVDAVRATGFDNASLVRLVIGLGAGGPYGFPDGYTSSGQEKPYISSHRTAIKEFLNNKTSWISTWLEDCQLKIRYVSVKAI